MIVLSFDIDWAPEAVISDTVDLLRRYEVPATFFATGPSSVLSGIDRSLFEIAIHPNPAAADDVRAITALLELYPESRGIRCHSLLTSTPLLNSCAKLGLEYESNQFFPYQVPVFRDFNGLLRIALSWRDYFVLAAGQPTSFAALDIRPELPAVFLFHPVHVFLNSESLGHYGRAKPHYHDPEALAGLRYADAEGRRGIRDFLIELIEACRRQRRPLGRLADLADQHRSRHGMAVTPALVRWF